MLNEKIMNSLHKESSYHRENIESSKKCVCFYCLESFNPSEIKEWIDKGQTALCPRCGIDSVLGDKTEWPLTNKIIKDMQKYWFDGAF